MNSKLNIYRKEWLEVVFAGRNKAYGAYELRNFSNRATNIGLGVVLLALGILFTSAFIYQRYFKKAVPASVYRETIMDLAELDRVQEEARKDEPKEKDEPVLTETKAPQQIAQDAPKLDLIKFTEPEIVASSKVTEDVATQQELNEPNKTSARLSLRANPEGTYIARGEFGAIKKDGAITGRSIDGVEDGNSNTADEKFTHVEIMPEPQGGMAAFMQWIAANYQFPDRALEQGLSGIVEVSFVVEKDGSLTDITVKRDMRLGTGEAAVNLLKKAKKWKPGIQNGRRVRVAYTLPIRLSAVSQ